MKRLLITLILLISSFLIACQNDTTTEVISECEWGFSETMSEEIKIIAISAPKSKLVGNLDNFINPCKPTNSHALLIKNPTTKSHQIVFEFDASYPLLNMVLSNYLGTQGISINKISIDVSLNGFNYVRLITDYNLDIEGTSISLNNRNAKYVRISFLAEQEAIYGLQDVRFYLGDGLIVKEAHEWSNAFLRYDGWVGADGIFSFNLNGDDSIGAINPTTAFVFSDTFVGKVNAFNNLRLGNVMLNNTLGYYNGNSTIFDGMTFDWRMTDGGPDSIFIPDDYLGYKPGNLLDSEGLSAYFNEDATLTNLAEGIMWKSAKMDQNYLIIDFYAIQSFGKLVLWNYNENPLYGLKDIEILKSNDGIAWESVAEIALNQASGNNQEPKSSLIDLQGVEARYLKINILSSFASDFIGLGKLYFESMDGTPLFGSIEASSYLTLITGNELSGRLWIQDGVVIGDYLYLFPILVKDEGNAFKVTRVTMIKAPIVNDKIDYQNAIYTTTPLQSKSPDGGDIYFGAGLMNHHEIDGFIYIYGYKDLNGRYLVVARVPKDDIENFNAWRYYDGENWSKNINDCAPLIRGVSPELSVTPIHTGLFAGQYMLVVMENTTSGRVSYSISDSPYGPFSDYQVLYETYEDTYLKGAFTYNAKMHAHLSQPGSYLISYNVNTTILSALIDARIYYPRFIIVTEVKKA
jgi:hypothetical protein